MKLQGAVIKEQYNNSNEHLVFRPQSLGSKNFRSVPEPVQAKIDSLEQDDFVIACVRKIPASDLLANKYRHLGISLQEGKPIFPVSQIPNLGVPPAQATRFPPLQGTARFCIRFSCVRHSMVRPQRDCRYVLASSYAARKSSTS